MPVAVPGALPGAGLLTDSDMVGLSAGLSVRDDHMYDEAVDAHHAVSPRIIPLCRSFEHGVLWRVWLKQAHEAGLSGHEIQKVVIFLNAIGGIRYSRHLADSVRLLRFRAQMYAYGVTFERRVRRWPATLGGCAKAVAWSCWPLALFVPATSAALSAVGLHWTEALSYPAGSLGLFYVSVLVHEQVHVYIAGDSRAVMIQRGLSVGLLHRQLRPVLELVSGLLGPLAGILTTLVGGFTTAYLSGYQGFELLGIVLALSQAASWLPWYGDGEAVIRYLKKREAGYVRF